MKQLFAIFLLSTFLANWASPYLPYIDYLINKEFIAKELCENKDKPALKCHGKCHLEKQIKKVAKKEKKGTTPFSDSKKNTKQLDYFISNRSNSETQTALKLKCFVPYKNTESTNYSDVLIPPPDHFS